MTAPASDLERKVRQLDNDVQSIYEMLTTIQGTQRRQGTLLDGMDARLERVEVRLDGVDKRLDGMDKRLDGMDKRLDGMDKRLDGMDKRFDGMDGKLDELLRRLPAT